MQSERPTDHEARYKRIIETTHQGVWVIDIESKTTFVNARMASMLGFDAQEVLGRSPADFMDDDEGREQFARHMAQRAQGASEQCEVRIRRKDGSSFWALVDSSPLLDAAGHRVGALATLSDNTGRREADEARARAEEAQRVSEAEYRFLFESSPLPKWVYDVETLRILAVNDAAVRAYGYSREELLAMTIADIRPAADAPPPKGHPSEYVEGTERVFLARHRRKDGTTFDVELHAQTFRRGDRACRLVVAQDVTERRRLEAQLRQAQKMEAVGRLAGGVAHDFNNVLSVILSYGDLLMGELKPGEPMRDDIEQIVEAGKRAAALTRQLLTFSRQQVVEPKVLDLNAVLADIDKMLRRILGADVDLTSVQAAELGRVRADAGGIEQAVMNLVVNARDAMPTGGQLTIETANVVLDEEFARRHAGVRPGPHVMLAVSDTGTGMDAATMARIFEPFFTTKDKGKGTGLGLSTVFGIVHQAGGTVWVYSEVDKGTTFKIYLPCVDAEAEAATPAAPRSGSRGVETILLVDDDDAVRDVARSILDKGGYTVMVARNAGEALLQSEKHPGIIHLLVTDVVMPHTSGPELAKRLAAGRPDMKVLCMSGYTDDSIVRHGVLESRVAFLQKPLTPHSLTRRVRDVLDGAVG